MKKYLILLVLSLCSFGLALSCSNNDKDEYLDVTDALTRYDEIPIVEIDLSGSAACKDCEERGIKPKMLQVEVVPSYDLTHVMAMDIVDNMGPFNFDNLKAEAGSTLIVYGKLFYGTGTANLSASTSIEVPNDDRAISCIINF